MEISNKSPNIPIRGNAFEILFCKMSVILSGFDKLHIRPALPILTPPWTVSAHYNDDIWASWRPKSLATRLFFTQAQLTHTWFLCGLSMPLLNICWGNNLFRDDMHQTITNVYIIRQIPRDTLLWKFQINFQTFLFRQTLLRLSSAKYLPFCQVSISWIFGLYCLFWLNQGRLRLSPNQRITWMPRCLQSPTTGLFVPQLVKIENIKPPHHWPLMSWGNRGFSSQRHVNAESVSMSWRHHDEQIHVLKHGVLAVITETTILVPYI